MVTNVRTTSRLGTNATGSDWDMTIRMIASSIAIDPQRTVICRQARRKAGSASQSRSSTGAIPGSTSRVTTNVIGRGRASVTNVHRLSGALTHALRTSSCRGSSVATPTTKPATIPSRTSTPSGSTVRARTRLTTELTAGGIMPAISAGSSPTPSASRPWKSTSGAATSSSRRDARPRRCRRFFLMPSRLVRGTFDALRPSGYRRPDGRRRRHLLSEVVHPITAD